MKSTEPHATPTSMQLPINYDRAQPSERARARGEYVRLQKGLCYYCHQSLLRLPPKEIQDKPIKRWLFPRSFFKNPVHLHHDHKTGMTIGAVHCLCNAVLWQYHGE